MHGIKKQLLQGSKRRELTRGMSRSDLHGCRLSVSRKHSDPRVPITHDCVLRCDDITHEAMTTLHVDNLGGESTAFTHTICRPLLKCLNHLPSLPSYPLHSSSTEI